jgi:hypothetical protein
MVVFGRPIDEPHASPGSVERAGTLTHADRLVTAYVGCGGELPG